MIPAAQHSRARSKLKAPPAAHSRRPIQGALGSCRFASETDGAFSRQTAESNGYNPTVQQARQAKTSFQMRPGHHAASALWNSADASRWKASLGKYDDVVRAMVPKKPPKTLAHLLADDK